MRLVAKLKRRYAYSLFPNAQVDLHVSGYEYD